MRFFKIEQIPFAFKNIYDEMLSISHNLKKKFFHIQTQKVSKVNTQGFLSFIKKKIVNIGNNYQFIGSDIPELPKCFLDGEKLLLKKISGFSLVAYINNDFLIIDPVTELHYWRTEGEYYLNGAPVGPVDISIDFLDYRRFSNSLLLFLKKIDNVKKVSLDSDSPEYSHVKNMYPQEFLEDNK